MIRYRYTHTGTEATTGYFSCEPEAPPDLAQALACLDSRPYDDFMRRHLLNRMAAMPAAEAEEAFRQAFAHSPAPSPALAGLAAELALIKPELARGFPLFEQAAAVPGAKESTPLIFLRWQELPDREAHRAWGKLFAANIQEHRALPAPASVALSPLYGDTQGVAAPAAPGTSAAFTAPYTTHIREVYERRLAGADPQGAPGGRPPADETAALALERLSALGIIAGKEMRHTASLSPVALLRPWHINMSVMHQRHSWTLSGTATTYGRGLSLDNARASCLMEMVERASAYVSVSERGVEDRAQGPVPLLRGSRSSLLEQGYDPIDPNDFPLEVPYTDQPLYWLPGTRPDGRAAHVPLQMASLFCNLDEVSLFDAPGSTGIATSRGMDEARLGALLEILERDAEATTPFHKSRCFTLTANRQDDPMLAALLEDYAARGINVQFQDMTGPLGVPVYQCFVMSPKGVIARGHGAGLDARRAVIAALTETPFPYPDGGPSGPMLRKLPERRFADLPDYSLHSPAASLAMLEELLERNNRKPVYVELTRHGLDFPVVRAFIPGMELAADSDGYTRVPRRLYENYLALFQG